MRAEVLRVAAVLVVTFASACGTAGADATADDPGAAPIGAPTSAGPAIGGRAPALPAPPPPPPSGRGLGANTDGDGVVFRVWAPHATAAFVTGEVAPEPAAMHLEDVDPRGRRTSGVWTVRLAGARAGQTYRYELETPAGRVARVDPYCREVRDAACVVVDPSAYAWKSAPFARPPRARSVVYEMHVGSFAVPDGAPHGTFASAQAGLARLGDVGFDVVELMPVQAFGGGVSGWGYNPQLYFAPKPTYGTSDELRAFVDEAHGRGMGVWLDVVMNHMDGWHGAPLYCFDGAGCDGASGLYYFPKGPYASTPWGPRLDYESPFVHDMVLDSLHAWLVEYRGDGFRWDSTSNIRGNDGQGTMPGGRDLLVAANDYTHALGGASVAEDLKGDDALTQATKAGGFGFDAQWDGFGYAVMDVLAGASDDARDLGRIEGALRASYAGDPFARLLWIENHDTVGNGGARLPRRIDPADPTSWAARKRAMLGATLLMTAPGVPMVFEGQEDLATTGFADPPVALAPPTPRGLEMRALYKDLIALRRNTTGGAGGLSEPGVAILHRNDVAKVLAYRRHGTSGEDVVVVVNLRNAAHPRYDVGVPAAGPWRVRVDTDKKTYGDDFGGGSAASFATLAETYDGQPFRLPLAIGAYSALVLTR